MATVVRSALLVAMAVLPVGSVAARTIDPPDRVTVLPIFFVPRGMPAPTDAQAATLATHLRWAQARFHEMLDCRATFTIAPEPTTIAGALPIGTYASLPEGGVPQMTSEVLAQLGHGRFDTPFVHLLLVMNPQSDVPPGGGRPCNGGYDTGGGVIVMSSYALDRLPNFQSTLQHELGHAFGLPHVDVYGYDMATNPSIMSYNPAHHTHFLEPSATPGVLIPEDVRGLAWNDRAFPRLAFDPATDLPPGYEPADGVWLGPMTIPEQPDGVVTATTTSGALFGSSVANAVQGRIRPSDGPGITFDAQSMWHSDVAEGGWVEVTLDFPLDVELDRIVVHSEHSGQYHRAEAAVVEVRQDGELVEVGAGALDGADASVTFPRAVGAQWRVRLQAGASGMVVVRGLQFHRGAVELFPPFIPEPVSDACPWDLDDDGIVGLGDLLVVLSDWGPAPIGPADFDCDGIVGQADLVELLSRWSE